MICLNNNPQQFGKVPSPPEPNEEQGLHAGDWIRCHDKDDMVDMFQELQAAGVDSDFRYERFGQKGLWLEILSVESEGA